MCHRTITAYIYIDVEITFWNDPINGKLFEFSSDPEQQQQQQQQPQRQKIMRE